MRRILPGVIYMCLAAVFFSAPVVYAQSTNDPKIQQRMENQDRRINQGIESGQLTPKEAGRLEAEQAKIRQDEARMKSDGNLTPKERQKLKREQNKANRDIYRLKHNKRAVPVN